MSVKIIKEGNKHKEIFAGKCDECGSTMEAAKEDLEPCVHPAQAWVSRPLFHLSKCPVCSLCKVFFIPCEERLKAQRGLSQDVSTSKDAKENRAAIDKLWNLR